MRVLFEQIFENSPVAMLLVNQDSRIRLVNKYTEQLFGYQRSELIDQSVDILVPKSIRPKHPSLIKAYFETPLPRQMGRGRNLFGMKKDGSQFPVEVGLNPIETEEGIHVMSSVLDITERVKAEERFKAVIEAAPNGMLMIDSEGTIVLINKQIEEMFGYDRSELINKPIQTLVPEEFKRPHPTFVQSYVSNPKPRSMGIGRELFGCHKSGVLIPVEIGLCPIYSEEGLFVISSVVDISERKQAENAIKEKTEELEQFSYRTSHDLRSPLISIGGLTDCILEDIQDNELEEAVSNLSKIKRLTSKLQNLVEDILILTKSDYHNEELSIFDFQNHFEIVKEKFSHMISDSGVAIQTELSHKKPLKIQVTRLEQVLDNFISNSIKYHNPSVRDRYVQVLTFNDQEQFFIQIEDNGLGIPEDKQEEVFGMFKRFHGGETVGSGLGLYIVKKNLDKLNAKVTFDSSTQGTTFYLKFPLNPE